jgi:hypothetical protein
MMLAEALIARKKFKTRLTDLQRRLLQSAVVQEGNQPHEDPAALLAELERVLAEYEHLIAQIHRTNLSARLSDGRSLTEATVARDILDEKMAILRGLADQAGKLNERYVHTELRYLPTVSVADLRKQIDAAAQARRKLDIAIQATNWQVNLVVSL